MRIGHYVSVVSRLPGYERNVSGHIQVPLHAMRLLAEAGQESHLITNDPGPDRVMPATMPPNVPVHFVIDSRRRRGSLTHKHTVQQSTGVYPAAFVRQARQIIRLAREHRFDVLHLYGHDRTALLGGLLRLARLRCPVVATIFGPPARPNPLTRPLWRRLGAIVTATQYVARCCDEVGLSARVVRHGIVRNLLEELDEAAAGPRRRVLFWRDPSANNGADLCTIAFESLAPRHREFSFDFAVRPYPTEVSGLAELAVRHPNVNLYRFPYPEGITLPRLIAESICVVLPFRKLSIDPQLAIAESLAAGVPVVTTDLRSSLELVRNDENGEIVPVGDAAALTEAIDDLLRDPARAAQMGRRAAEMLAAEWNWERYVKEMIAIYSQVNR